MLFKQTLLRYLKTSVLFGLMFFVFGCASYHDRIAEYYQNVGQGEWAQAEKALDKNPLLKKPRNKLLYLLEKGRLAHLAGDYTQSNVYLNQADLLFEVGLSSVGDAIVGSVLNPMSQNYKGEDFEAFLLHYYKALNYFYLGDTQAALVEARRINLQTIAQGDKFSNKDSRYSKDAFSLVLQGLIYEADSDINNAFIAYRNAVEVYQQSPDTSYYGVQIPENLKFDVMRMAYKMGFTSELHKFEQQFGTTFVDYQTSEAGELVLFWENGVAPIKRQEDLFFSLVKGQNGSLFFTDALGGMMIPFDFGIAGNVNVNDIHSLRVALPKYQVVTPLYESALAKNADDGYYLELVQDVNTLAIQTLKQRWSKELGSVLTRLAIKKSAEYALSSASKSSDGKNDMLLEGLGLGVQLFSLLSEKADTRNWQTLPGTINYARIPLHNGVNTIELELKQAGGQVVKQHIEIESAKGLQFYNVTTMN